tara:strand:+ start:245 stop:1945 length:1701 start_codon:yes stop_codon:yes gene_type:complete
LILDLCQNSKLESQVFDTLRKISLNKIGEFNDLIGNVSETQSNNVDWWIEQPASRNIHQSPLFYRFCCIHLIIELINSGTNIEKIIVDSAALSGIIKKLKEKQNLNFEIYGPTEELPRFPNYIWKSIKPFFKMWKKKRAQFRAAIKTKNLTTEPPKIPLTLIDQFVFPKFITKERYYNGLWDSLSPEQQQKTFFVPTLVMMGDDEFEAAYHELRTSKKNFLIKEDYLTSSDLIFSLLHLFRVWFIKLPFQDVLGVNFSTLIREELISGVGHFSAFEGLLNYRFAKRLKEKLFNLFLVIDWWEGQPMDKGWNLGFHTYFPETTLKGYLGYAPRTIELQLRPSESEIRYGAAPAIIATIGEKFSCEMNSTKPSFRAETAPAFRFGHLWETRVEKKSDYGSYRILMALSFDWSESVDILEQVIDSGLVESEELNFILQPHPTVKLDTLKNCLGNKWPSRFQEGEQPTPEEIRQSDLLITGISSIGLEAIVMGIPVIVVERMTGLAYDPIPESVPKVLWWNCRSPEGISKAIKSFRGRSPEEIRKHRAMSADIKDYYFEPITIKGVYKFL